MAFGQTDTTFGVAGHAITPFTNPSSTPEIREIHLAGGAIVAAGPGGIAKYTSAGQPDTSFGSSTGKVKLPNVTFTDMEVDSSGRIYVLGTGSAGILVLRYTAAGALDTSFASGGTALVTTNTSGKSFSPQALQVQSDGKILVGGIYTTDSGNSSKARIYRLGTNGAGDTSFNSSGILDIQLGAGNFLTPTIQDTVTDILVLADGKILVMGGSRNYAPSFNDPDTGDYVDATFGDNVFAAARINTNGTLDTTYGSSGVARATYATGKDTNLPSASAALPDGTCAIAANDDNEALKVAQFNSSGAVAFNKSAELGNEFGSPTDMAAKGDGRWIILGNNGARPYGLQMIQVTTSGVFSNVTYTDDTDKDTVDISGSTGAIAIASDGDLLVGGSTGDSTLAFELGKFDEGSANAPRPDEFVNARANKIFRDALGGIHLAYFDAAAKVLKYAYRAPNGLWEAPVTVDGTENAGQYVAIGADAKGNPGIAYFEGTHGDFKFAYKTANVWKTETVEGAGSTGLYPALKFDNSGRPTVLYYNKSKGDAKFAVRNMTTNTWAFETVQSKNNVGRSGDLQVDPTTGRFAVVYTDSTTGGINYALHQKGGKWSIGQAATTVGGADFLSLSYTYYGRKPAIAYYDANRADAKLTTQNSAGTGWTTRVLATKGKVGLYNSLFYDSEGAHLYTYDKSNDQLLLIDDNPSGLTATAIVKSAGNYANAFSNSSVADVSYYDAVNGVLKVRGAPVRATN
jgi:uncharacterized delta-60 repeat protein